MHLILRAPIVADIFCRKLEVDPVMPSMKMLCLYQKEISYSQKEAVWEKKRWVGNGEGEAWIK